ncbi:hypothetical protein BD414DRAFT_539375 [Trametes punicea]|nr:hypothetical protein BD414DRAFT_539375 [Trametes punicea]
MATLTVILNSTVLKPLASVKGRGLRPMAKVKSTFSKFTKPGVVPSDTRRLRRQDLRKRVPRKSLPRVLDPLPEDLCVPLLKQVEDELFRLHVDGDKASDDACSSHMSEFTLFDTGDSKSKGSVPAYIMKDPTVGDTEVSSHIMNNTMVVQRTPTGPELGYDPVNDLFYARETLDAAELALFEIKVVPPVSLPVEDYYSGEAIIPTEGYEASLVVY